MSEIQSAPAPLNKPVPSTGSGRRDRRGSDGGNALFSSAALVPALLASSCCIPQLVLNFFSFSCMGFAILTPFRPFFLALTAIGVAAAVQRGGLSRRTVVLGLLAACLAFSDVAVRQYNEGTLQRAEVFGQPLPGWLQKALAPPQWVPRSQLETKASRGHPFSPPSAAAAAAPQEATVIMTAMNIKCAACGARIKTGLQAKFGSHVTSVDIQEKSKAVIVRLRDQAAVNDRALLAAMAELKSPAKLVRRDVQQA